MDGPLDFWVSNDTAKIWVVDTYNNKVKVATLAPSSGGVPAYGPWEDLAGSGEIGFQDGDAATASFYQPHGLAVAESAGYAYVSDTFASCIRSISLRTGAVKTIAGTCGQGGHRDFPGSAGGGALGSSGRSGSALDARFNHVHKVTLDPRNESLLYVSDVECSDDGPLHIEELCRKTYNNTIFTGVRRLEISSKDGGCTSVSTVAGYFDPSNPTADHPLGFADGPIETAKFHYIHGVAFQPLSEAEKATLQHGGHGSRGSTAMYACDDDNFAIRKIDFVAKNVTTLAGTGTQGCADGDGAHATLGAVGLGLGEDGTIYVADYLNHRIRQLSIGGRALQSTYTVRDRDERQRDSSEARYFPPAAAGNFFKITV